MQSFLPIASFTKTAEILDNNRLNKQITEVKGIYRILIGQKKGYANHPAVAMWRGYEHSLLVYGGMMYTEWQIRLRMGKRGGKLDHKAGEFISQELSKFPNGQAVKPFWFGMTEFHSSHRACLLLKDFDYYSQFGWQESPAIMNEDGSWPYFWPV